MLRDMVILVKDPFQDRLPWLGCGLRKANNLLVFIGVVTLAWSLL